MMSGLWDLFVVCEERDTTMVSSLQMKFGFCTPAYGQKVSVIVEN